MKILFGWICKLYAAYLRRHEVTSTHLLHLARCLIITHGWCKEELYDDRGRMCTIGAMSRAHSLLGQLYTPAYDRAINDIVESLRERKVYHGIAYWNDRMAKGKMDVVKLLTTAAKKADAKQAVAASDIV